MGFLNIEYKKTKYTFQSHSQNSIFIVNVIVESNHCPTLPALPQRQVFDCQTVPEQVGVSLVSWCGIKKKEKRNHNTLSISSRVQRSGRVLRWGLFVFYSFSWFWWLIHRGPRAALSALLRGAIVFHFKLKIRKKTEGVLTVCVCVCAAVNVTAEPVKCWWLFHLYSPTLGIEDLMKGPGVACCCCCLVWVRTAPWQRVTDSDSTQIRCSPFPWTYCFQLDWIRGL